MDFAFRWSNYFDQLEVAISHFSGTSREPRFILSNENLKELVPLYEVIDQTGFEFQYLLGSFAIKSEIISRSGQEDRFTAATYGFAACPALLRICCNIGRDCPPQRSRPR